MRDTRHVRGPEIKLRPVTRKERRVPSALFLRQHVSFSLELRVRRDAPRLCNHLPALDVLALYATQQQTNVVACRAFVQQLLEHLHTRHHRSEEHTSELQSQSNLVCRLLLEKKKKKQ